MNPPLTFLLSAMTAMVPSVVAIGVRSLLVPEVSLLIPWLVLNAGCSAFAARLWTRTAEGLAGGSILVLCWTVVLMILNGMVTVFGLGCTVTRS